jgi:hypothetical protein
MAQIFTIFMLHESFSQNVSELLHFFPFLNLESIEKKIQRGIALYESKIFLSMQIVKKFTLLQLFGSNLNIRNYIKCPTTPTTITWLHHVVIIRFEKINSQNPRSLSEVQIKF